MRVGMLTTGYPHEHDPVPGAFVRGMARALSLRGHTVRVLCARRPGSASPVSDPGVDVLPVKYLPRERWQRTFYRAGAPDALAARDALAWAGALAFVPALLARGARDLGDCDALVSHFVIPCGLVGGALRRERPHLSVAHGTDAAWFARAPAWAQRAVLDGCTALRMTHRAAWEKLAPGVRDDPRVSVYPTGYDPAQDAGRRETLRARLGVRAHETLVLGVGRAVDLKGYDLLLDAAAMVRDSCVVAFVGDGPALGALRARALSLGVRAHFAGALGERERDEYLCAADVFAAPSRVLPDGRTEGAPVSVMEAMGSGLAVVASDAGGLPELVGDAGLVFPAGNARALAASLRALLADAPLRASLGARAKARAWPWRWGEQARWIEGVLSR